MTKHDCVMAIAHKRWLLRQANELPGDEHRDWEFAKSVFRFFADNTAPRTSEWQMKADDYEPYQEIYERYLWII